MKNHGVTAGPITAQLTKLALPLLLGNILQQCYNMIDALILGWVQGSDAFGAVGIGGTVMNLFLFLLTGACTGVCVILSHLYGKQDVRTFRREFFQAIFFGGLFAVLAGVGFLLVTEPLLRLIRTPDALMESVTAYLHIILGGLLVVYAYNLFAAALRAVGDTFAALVFLGISLCINLVLDIWFVSGLSLGIVGAAWATVLSQLFAAVLSAAYWKIRYPQLALRREDLRMDSGLLLQTIRFASASALQQASIYLGKLLVQGVVNGLGTASISAYTAATRIEAFANSFGDSGSAAESVFIGQNAGAGNRQRVQEGFRISFRLMVALGVVMALHLSLRVVLSWILTESIGLAGVALATGAGWALAVSIHQMARKRISAGQM